MNSIVKIDRVAKVYRVGDEDFTALHEISLEIDAAAGTMQMIIQTTLTNGQSATWTADYVVSKSYD